MPPDNRHEPGGQTVGGGDRPRLASFWTRLSQAFRGRCDQPELIGPPPAYPVNVEVRPAELLTPSARDCFRFKVELTSVWSGNGDRAGFEQLVKTHEPDQRMVADQGLRKISRRHSPDEFEAVEQEMNNYLADEAPYRGPLRCRMWVRVGPEDRLIQHLQQQWITGASDAAAHDRARCRPRQLAELIEAWAGFLRGLPQDSVIEQALQLAENPKQIAQIAARLQEERVSTEKRLHELCADAVAAHQKLDLYEFVRTYDSALTRLLTYLGAEGGQEFEAARK